MNYTKKRHIFEANLLLEKRFLNEQGPPDEIMDKRGIAITSTIRGDSDDEYVRKLKEYKEFSKIPFSATLSEIFGLLTIDNIVDIIAAVLDGIPGVGNAVSFGVDIIHAISYFIRAFIYSDDLDKLENVMNGVITCMLAYVPLAGNIASIGIRGTIKKLINQTDSEVIAFLKRFGIILNQSVRFDLKKDSKFVYRFLAAIASFIIDKATEVQDSKPKIQSYIENLSKQLKEIIKKLNSVTSYIPFFNRIIEAIEYASGIVEDAKKLLGDDEPSIEILGGFKPSLVPFKNQEEGNKFRTWFIKKYPTIANTLTLSPIGPYDNENITNAWNYVLPTAEQIDGIKTAGDVYKKIPNYGGGSGGGRITDTAY
jgi:hypothetical protein